MFTQVPALANTALFPNAHFKDGVMQHPSTGLHAEGKHQSSANIGAMGGIPCSNTATNGLLSSPHAFTSHCFSGDVR